MSSKVVVQDLQKRYGAVRAVRGVSFDIREGEIFALLGPNGAGKTTTLECLLGLREPDGGEIEVCGIDARRHPREVRQRVGAALQTTALHAKITPREALELFGSFYRRHAEAGELLERFSLEEVAERSYDALSGGQQQRVALALAFVNRPELVVLDEPTAGLDPRSRRELRGEIAQMRRDGYTVLLTTHSLEEAEQLCDRVGILDRGRIVATGTPRELIERSGATPTVLLETSRPLDAGVLAALPQVEELRREGVRVSFRTREVRRSLAVLLGHLEAEGVEVVELRVSRASLEDVFLELTGMPLRAR